ncbi:MAG: hypothetical protein KGJ07_04605 [Patescibacteria group bacterium]|nr:hypothetical protein [Patescibacteria group bacterium]
MAAYERIPRPFSSLEFDVRITERARSRGLLEQISPEAFAQRTQQLEAKIVPSLALFGENILPNLRHRLGNNAWGMLLFALDQTMRGQNDPVYDVLGQQERYQESNLTHCANMLVKANKLFHAVSGFAERVIPNDRAKEEFVIAVLAHDAPEALTDDVPAFGPLRQSDEGQKIKAMEWHAARFMARQIGDPDVRVEWLSLYKEMDKKKSFRARVLKFIDKWDGSDTAYTHYYRYAHLYTGRDPELDALVHNHIVYSADKIATTAHHVHKKIRDTAAEQQFQQFVAGILTPYVDSGFDGHVRLALREHSFRSEVANLIFSTLPQRNGDRRRG